MIDTQKYITLFVEEAREIVAGIASTLRSLSAEESPRGETLQALFRSAHSLKGMSSSMGYDELATLAHAFENILQSVQENPASWSKEIFSLAVDASDFFDKAIDEIQQTSVAQTSAISLIGELEKHLSGLSDSAVSADKSEKKDEAEFPANAALEEIPQETKDSVFETRGTIYRIAIKIDPQDPLPSARAMVAFKAVENISTSLLEMTPSPSEIVSGKFQNEIFLRISSEKTAEEIESAIKSLSSIVECRVESVVTEAEETRAEEPERDAALHTATQRVSVENLDHFFNYASEFIVHHGRLVSAIEAGATGRINQQLDRIKYLINEFYEEIVSLRMMPFETIIPRVERIIRDAERQCGKGVDFSSEGTFVRLDRSVLDELIEPLTHVIRNAVDHGIEPSDVRRQKEKPDCGKIEINVARKGDIVEVRIADDGQGMDPKKIKQSAIEKGYLTPERANAMSADEALMLATIPGFSTRSAVSTLSGRGVGLDVVRTKIETLGGHLKIASKLGEGTVVIFQLPPTMSILRAFMVEAKDELYAIPISDVRRTVQIDKTNIQRAGGEDVVWLNGESMHFRHLGAMLSAQSNNSHKKQSYPCLIIYKSEKPYALAVDKISGTADIVVKPLKEPLEELRLYFGATIVGDGRVALIIDVANLLP